MIYNKIIQYLDHNYLIMYRQITEFKRFRSLFGKQKATQEIATISFSFGITKAEWINSILEIMAKFIFIQMTKIKS